MCPTLSDAEAAAQRILDDLGGGELLIYDPDLRLRTAKRGTGGANRSGDRQSARRRGDRLRTPSPIRGKRSDTLIPGREVQGPQIGISTWHSKLEALSLGAREAAPGA